MIAVAGRRIHLTTIVLWILGTFLVLLWAAPLFWMFSTSLKPEGQILTPTVEWLPRQVVFTNYVAVFQEPVARWFLNSVVVSVVDTIGALVVGAMAGYALARLHFPGRGLIFFLILAALMIPGEMTIVPLYVGALKLGLASTYFALILPAVADVFTVYLFRQFFLNLPFELEDAAAIDGCNRFQTFFHVALPLAQ